MLLISSKTRNLHVRLHHIVIFYFSFWKGKTNKILLSYIKRLIQRNISYKEMCHPLNGRIFNWKDMFMEKIRCHHCSFELMPNSL